MHEKTEQLGDTEAVRNYIRQTLCSRDNLQLGSFAVSETPLRRGAKVCGLYFCLHGPRLLRLTAIWDTNTNTILFYSSQGERFLKTRISGQAGVAAAA